VVGTRGWTTPNSPHTLESLLDIMDGAGVDPWLQIEMYMTEAEWLGWVEYMAAPYDPDLHTAETRPWAHKRYAQGHPQPWTEVFESLLLELSNETWNRLFSPWTFLGRSTTDAATGVPVGDGELYGLWQEYVIGVLRSSPYWTAAVEDRFEFVLGGWTAQRTANGYGQRAAAASPSSLHLTVAGYNGGWDEGEPPAEPDDPTRTKTLTFAVQAAEPRARALAETLAAQRASDDADYVLGTYEAGPGYNLNGLNGVSMTQEQVEAESQVMKSLVGGTATLDSFLVRAAYGYELQNFFTYERNRHYWVSHARWENGGHAYPPWSALTLYNRFATGDHLLVSRRSSPTWDLPRTPARAALEAAPMTAVYATRSGDRVGVFLISRKLDGYPIAGDDGFTPLTVNLPFRLGEDGTITLHTLTGDTRSHNLDGDNVGVVSVEVPTDRFSQSFVLNAARGADERGLPPASVYLYVFEDVELPEVGPDAAVTLRIDDGRPAQSLTLPAVFRVTFDQPVVPDSFTSDDVQVAGTAAVQELEVEPVPRTAGTVFLVRITAASSLGTIRPSIPAGAVDTAAGGVSLPSTYEGEEFALGVPDQGGTYAFVATDDTRLSNYAPGPNGADPGLRTLGDYTRDWGDRAVLKFPRLPELGDRLPSSAWVRVFHAFRPGDVFDYFHVLLAFHDEWDEETLDLSLPEASALHGDDEVSPLVSVQVPEQWYEFDCTGYVLEELSGDRTVSVVLDLSPEGTKNSFLTWRSKEYQDAAYAPELVLSFAPLVEE